ncbi:UTP--glucose-1-phosphate uridylyltransferase [Desulfovibrionales bacterium]
MSKNIACVTVDDPKLSALFRPFALKMEQQSLPAIVINTFKCYFNQFLYGAQGKLNCHDILPITDNELPEYETLERYKPLGERTLHKAAVIKLNGGLGTSMGLESAKSLIPVKDCLNFLDLILLQAAYIRSRYQVEFPQIFMNSFKTHMETMMKIGNFNNGATGISLAFLQHRYPKILAKDFTPATWPQNPELEWNPPGHGDIYTALVTSGLLDALLERGYEYAFISNSDNLGAIMNRRLLGYMVHHKLPFLMEVARRTDQDKKGGHLCRLKKNNQFALREVAQCPDQEMDLFCDINTYKFFNTNSIWVDLRVVQSVFIAHRMMPLDLIINPKTLDPRDPNSPRVFQLETAMGSAITSFANAQAVIVPRKRFAPVKTTADLLQVMSDCYIRTEQDTITPNPARELPMPQISLDQRFYRKIDAFLERIPQNPPSLMHCTSLTIEGDVRFEENVRCEGDVRIVNTGPEQAVIPAHSTLQGDVLFS